MRKFLLATTGLFAVCGAHAQTVDLNLSNVTQDGGSTAFDTHYGFGGNETNLATGETQHYSNANVSTANGAITLTAEPTGQSGAITSGTETQGMPTAGGFTLNGYGTLNITASVPDGANLWGALWLEPVTSAANPKPSPCEIDIMESPFNTATKYQASLHDGGSGYTTGVNVGSLTQANTYGVSITPSTISYLLNGQVVGQVATPASCQNQKFYLLANVAEGGWASQYANGQATAGGTMTISKITYTPTDGGSASGGLIGAASGTAVTQSAPVTTAASTAAVTATPNPTSTTATTTQAAATTGSPTAATGSTVTPTNITPGQGSVTDCKGNVWTIQTDGNRIKEGEVLTPGGGGTSALTLQGCTVYGQDIHSGQWFTLSSNDAGADQYWTQSAAPSGETNQPMAQTPTPTPTDPTTPSQNNCTAAAAGAGGFHVANGQIIGPNGQVWIARGINIYGPDAGTAAQTVTKVFTGVNFFRYIARSYFDPSSVQGFVNQMTGEGRVVEFEDHPNGGGDQDAGPPGGMAAEMAWYSAMAKAYAGNPYVWFGTYNEPKPTANLSPWQRATYDAIRGAGNNSPIMLEVSGSRPSNLQQALNPTVYATMTNVLWDAHDYPYMNDYNKDPTSITENINALITAAQTIRSADGLVPVIIGESGPSTTGLSLDPNGYATVEGLIKVASSGKMGGLAPFAWGTSTPNAITDGNGNPTSPYGQMVQLFINTDVVTPSQCQTTQRAQQTTVAIQQQMQSDPTAFASPAPSQPVTTADATQTANDPAMIKQAQAAAQVLAQ